MLELDKVKNFSEDKRRSRFFCLLYTHLFILLILSGLRGLFHLLFHQHEILDNQVFYFYAIGLLFDFRAALLILAPITGACFLPVTIQNASYIAKIVLVLQAIHLFFYFSFSAIDLIHFDLTKMRVSKNFTEMILSSPSDFSYIGEHYPVLTILGLALVLSLVIVFILQLLLKKYLFKGQYGLVFFPYRFERLLWFLVAVPLVYAQLAKLPARNKDYLNSKQEFLNQLGMNPLNNILEDVVKN